MVPPKKINVEVRIGDLTDCYLHIMVKNVEVRVGHLTDCCQPIMSKDVEIRLVILLTFTINYGKNMSKLGLVILLKLLLTRSDRRDSN